MPKEKDERYQVFVLQISANCDSAGERQVKKGNAASVIFKDFNKKYQTLFIDNVFNMVYLHYAIEYSEIQNLIK